MARFKEIDLQQDIAQDYSTTEEQTLQDIINRTDPGIRKGLEVIELHTEKDGATNYGVMVDTHIIDFEIGISSAGDNNYYFIKV